MGFLFSRECPGCGRSFNWWQRAIGEYRQHLRGCAMARQGAQSIPFSTGCRGCPAGCYEKGDDRNDHEEPPGC